MSGPSISSADLEMYGSCRQCYGSFRKPLGLVTRQGHNITKITVNQTGAFHFSQVCSEDVFNFFQKQTDDSYRFISELMYVFCMAGVRQQPEQSNFLAEGQI